MQGLRLRRDDFWNGADAELGAPFDEDLEAVGAVLRGSRLYVLLAAKTFTTGASLVLVKVRMRGDADAECADGARFRRSRPPSQCALHVGRQK